MKRYIHYGFVLIVIAAISAGTLAFVNGKTAPTIKENAIKAVEIARKNVLPTADSFDTTPIKSSGYEYFKGLDKDGNIVGYVASGSEIGYAGPINFVVGFDVEGVITGLNIVSNIETPGLGSKIKNLDWQHLWIGRDKDYAFDKSVDAFAGATISPNAVYVGIKKILKGYEEVKNNG